MPILHCTQKLLKDIGLSSQELKESPSPSSSILGDWYANLLLISKRKAILFTNEKTLFSFLGSGVTKGSHLRVKFAFLAGMRYDLLAEGIEESIVEQLLSEYQELGFAKAQNRHILGSMNDIAKMFEFLVHYEGGWNACDPREITKKVNQSPMKFLQYRCASDSIHEILDKRNEGKQ
jgi:hypothetical protein